MNAFAAKHRLKLQRDTDGTTIVPGRKGKSHIFEYDPDRLGVMIMPETGTGHWWNAARAAFIAAGMTISQNGDCEGVAVFDPKDRDQVRLALRYAKVTPKRKVSPERAASLRLQLDGSRTAKESPLEP